MTKAQLIGTYYGISELLGDEVVCVADALRHFTSCTKKREAVIDNLECLKLVGMSQELDELYGISVLELRAFHTAWQEQADYAYYVSKKVDGKPGEIEKLIEPTTLRACHDFIVSYANNKSA
jgi:hypothetical protein